MISARLVLRDLGRNKVRTTLLVASVFFTTLLVLILLATLAMWTGPDTAQTRARLVVRNLTSLTIPLPISYRERLQQVPGVEIVLPMNWFGGVIEDSDRFFAQFASDPKKAFDVWEEQKVSPETLRAFQEQKTAAVVGESLMQSFGWKVGQRITLLGRIYPVDVELTIVGTYKGGDEGWVWFRWDYLDELISSEGSAGIVGTFYLKLANSEDAARVAREVDGMFANSFARTRTETEMAFNLSFLEMLGNLRMLLSVFGAAAVFTTLLVTGNAMATTVRERTGEMAVLKTIGFGRGRVLGQLLLESVLVTTLGGVLGCAAGFGLATVIRGGGSGWFANFQVLPQHLAAGLFLAAALGVLSAAWPAFHGASLRISDGLRRAE